MLFRFTDFSLKNSILCNYEDLKSKEDDQELNDDIDNNLNPGLCNFIGRFLDKLFHENYEILLITSISFGQILLQKNRDHFRAKTMDRIRR